MVVRSWVTPYLCFQEQNVQQKKLFCMYTAVFFIQITNTPVVMHKPQNKDVKKGVALKDMFKQVPV